MLRWFVLLLSTFLLIPPTFAQSDCSAVVDAALNSVSTACAGLARNQACYGNINLQATAREGVPQFTFEQPGDMANVADMENLRLAGMSLTDEVWGIAVMKLQANLPSTLPGQNVTVLLFGDVYVSNAVDPVVQSTLVATGNVNVRLRPTTTTNNVMASLVSGQEVTANGRLADNSWIRIVVEGDARGVGWVSSQFLDGDIEELSIVEPEQPLFGPMQAFYLQTGIGDSPCAEVPDSGILVQSPEGAVHITINDVDIQLGSTVYFQAGDGVMTASVLEGHATLTTNGVTQSVPAGTSSEIPIGVNGRASGNPGYPQPYDDSRFAALPLVLLPETITAAQPLAAEEITGAVEQAEAEAAGNFFPLAGNYFVTYDDGRTWIWTIAVVEPLVSYTISEPSVPTHQYNYIAPSIYRTTFFHCLGDMIFSSNRSFTVQMICDGNPPRVYGAGVFQP